MDKIHNEKAWLMVLPVVLIVSFSAIVPLMTVVNYSIQDIFDPTTRIFVGTEWFEQTLSDPELRGALGRQLVFSLAVLAIEVPLGIVVALCMPRQGPWVSVCLVLLALPLLVPWNVVGTIWQIFARPDIGLAGVTINALGIEYNYTEFPLDAWLTVLAMDVWHWTSLVVLLCYAGLQAIPSAYYQAARIDGASRWAVFRFIELPKMRGVLMIAILLRFMDSFKIYAEPFVLTSGGPGNATTFLSQKLATMGVGQFDLGPAGAFSLVYFLIILAISYVFYQVINNLGKGTS
jgi:glycerol transport system permease protein